MKKQVFVSAVILKQSNQILMSTRPEGKTMAGFWEFPGGKVEDGETFEETAIRELGEELSIQILPQNLNYFANIKHAYDDFKLEMNVYTCDNWGGDINPQENQIYRWFSADEIDYSNVIPADVELIKQFWEMENEKNTITIHIDNS